MKIREWFRRLIPGRSDQDLESEMRFHLEIATAVLTVAVAANTLIFMVVSGVLLKPMPYRDPDRLVRVFESSQRYPKFPVSMAKAARQIDHEPRRLSFSRSRESFWAFARAVAYVDSQEKFEYHLRLLLRSISQCKLPKRHRPPAPRGA